MTVATKIYQRKEPVMSTEVTQKEFGLQQEVFGDVKRNWGWLLALGIVFVILGFIGLGMTFAITMASVLMYGVLLLIGAGAQFVDAAKCKGWKGIVWHVLIALLYVVAGIAVIENPLAASVILTLMLAGVLIVVGLIRGIMAFQMRGFRNWIWPLLGGLVSIILGLIIMANWPISGLWVIGLFVSIELMVHGWSYIFVAMSAKSA
jgi:uncharacterized membrane protein HdeD (DUF308 family)